MAVVLLAGPGAVELAESLFDPLRPGPLVADALRLGRIVDGEKHLDEALLCLTASERVEINLHGGPVVAAEVLDLLAHRGARILDPDACDPALRLAHPRWDNPAIGRELMASLHAATGPSLLKTLARQWSGGLSELAASHAPSPDAIRQAVRPARALRRLLDGADVAIVGPPNAGKSALANALVGRDASLVHDHPGTTRDWVRSAAQLLGWPLWITDTAGLWGSRDPVDVESIRRTRRRASQADVVLLLDDDEPADIPDWLVGPAVIRVASKCDLRPPASDESRDASTEPHGLAVSSRTGTGLDALRRAILVALDVADLDPARPAAFTQRQASLCLQAGDALERDDLPAARDALDALLRGQASQSASAPQGHR